MASTTVKRKTFCMTHETRRQLDDLCARFKENPSQVITRALQLLHYSVRFPNVPLKTTEEI